MHIQFLYGNSDITLLYFRRGKAESGDIDVLLTHPSYNSKDGNKKKSHLLKLVVDALKSKNLIIDTISHGDVKFMVSNMNLQN